MTENFIEMLESADNVYRTNHFIVLQDIGINYSDVCDNQLVSRDLFICRNPERDLVYEILYQDKMNINGKRIPTSMSTRKYVE